MPSELVIVYHRQPYEEVVEDGKTVFKENKSPNGIVPTLKSLFGRVDRGAWVAWKQAEDPSNPDFERVVEIEDAHGSYTVSRLPLTAKQVSSFYHVTSKEAMWPILHGFRERYNYDPVDWPTFREVNWAFAEAAAAEAAEGAIVWVHDYNLWLVPGFLRQMRPDLKISFYHHTPFPAADMFNALPWRKEIVESLMACDCVGFHIPRYANNFASVALSLTDAEVEKTARVHPDFVARDSALSDRHYSQILELNGHKVHLTVSGVGIDSQYIDNLARSEETATKVEAVREELGDARLVLSVGRTDYTKGGIEQLLSFERVLEAHPELHGKLRLMHVSVSANTNMTAYEQVQTELEATAGRINATYGSFEWQPVSMTSSPVPFKELVAYYQAADVLWITPLADGMNLVCKEFVSARTDEQGVLILSEFAGAAVELHEAIHCNPYSHRSMDHTLIQALAVEEDEARSRMHALRDHVKTYGIAYWAQEQLRPIEKMADIEIDVDDAPLKIAS